MVFILVVIVVLIGGLAIILAGRSFFEDRDIDLPGLSLEPKAYGDTSALKGVNLGNAFDAPTVGGWGVIIKPEYLQYIHEAGFNIVRFPVRVSAHTQKAPSYTIDPALFAQMDDIISAAMQNELIVILDVHHYIELMDDPAGEEARFLAIWQQLGEHYKDYPANLYFELLNEPTGKLDYASWNVLLAKGIKTVRATNPQRKILIDTAHGGQVDGIKELVLPDDPNLIATFHYYEPLPFTHQGADWVEGATKWMGTTWTSTVEERQQIDNSMDMAAQWSKDHRTPVVLGEFGAIFKADKASRARWMAFTARQAEEHNIGWIHWQLCSDFPLFDCEENRWDAEMLNALIPAQPKP
jgi:endoglucanase